MGDAPTLVGEQPAKDVYAHFGLAAYWAQCIEMSLGNFFLIHLRLNNMAVTVQELDAMDVTRQKQTLGHLIKDFRKYVSLDTDCEDVLSRALEQRNFLMHHFFQERAFLFASNDGRSQMINELTELTDDLRRADAVIVTVYQSLGRTLGITDDMIDMEFDRQRRQAGNFCTTSSTAGNSPVGRASDRPRASD